MFSPKQKSHISKHFRLFKDILLIKRIISLKYKKLCKTISIFKINRLSQIIFKKSVISYSYNITKFHVTYVYKVVLNTKL